MKTCEKCKKEFEGEGNVCTECNVREPIKLEDKKLSPKRFILIAADFALIIIGLLVFLIPTFFDENRNISGRYELSCYVEGDTLYCRNIGDLNADVVTLSQGIGEDEGAFYDFNISYSSDSTVVFFPTDFNIEDGSFKLCYYDFKTNGPVKDIAQNVASYDISSDGLTVYYVGGDETLYHSNLESGTAVAENVIYFELADDASKLIYTTGDGIYVKTALGEPARVGATSDYYELIGNFDSVVLVAEDGKITKTDFDGKFEIVSEESDDLHICTSGEIYYIIENAESSYAFDEEYGIYSLYYYNGSESVLVTDRGVAEKDEDGYKREYAFALYSAATVYRALNEDFELTEGTAAEELRENTASYHSTGATETICIDESGRFNNYYLSNKGTHIYCNEEILSEDGEYIYNLYEINLANGTDAVLMQEDYCGEIYYISDDDRVAYAKTEGEKEDLYFSDTLIVENWTYDDVSSNLSQACFAVSTDEGLDLYAYLNNELKLVCENVGLFESNTEGSLMIYYTKDLGDGTHELHRYNAWNVDTVIATGSMVDFVTPMV